MRRHYNLKHGRGQSPPPPSPEDFRFQHPFTAIVSGPTSCGKTRFVKEMLKENVVDPAPQRILWLYKRWQPLYDDIRRTVTPRVEFVKGVPVNLESDDFFDPRIRNLVVLDDLMSTAVKDSRITDLFTEGSHHRNLSVVAIKQSLYYGRDPTQRRNCHYLILFNNPVDRQPISTLGRQMYPSRGDYLLRTFEEATRRPYGYLVVDLKPTTPEALRLRPNVLEESEDGPEDPGDLVACADCGVVFVDADTLRNHLRRECQPPAKRCRGDDEEGTYGYELECFLKGLPATVCCAEELPADVADRPHSYVVNTDSCRGKGIHWVAFHFPVEGPAEFFDSFGRAPETYHRRFRNVLINNGPQYMYNTVRVQPEDGDSCGLYCVHYIKNRYKDSTLQQIVDELAARDPQTVESELEHMYR